MIAATIRRLRSKASVRLRARRQRIDRLLFAPTCRAIYCPIPKVACSSLKQFLLEVEGFAESRPGEEPSLRLHLEASRHLSLGRFDAAGQKRLLDDLGNLKFIFVRNPWSRLVSAYVDKFARAENPEGPVREVVRRLRPGQSAEEHSVTFAEFVGFVASESDLELDEHWRPQSWFARGIRFDFVGRFETLAQDFTELAARLGIERPLGELNRMRYQEASSAPGSLADATRKDLRDLRMVPHYTAFYTDELCRSVAQRYRDDVELFDYAFEGYGRRPSLP